MSNVRRHAVHLECESSVDPRRRQMLELITTYAPLLLVLASLLLLLLVWQCYSILRRLNDVSMLHLINYLERADAAKRDALQMLVGKLDERLGRIEGHSGFAAQRMHDLAAHFVPRLKTEQDIRDDCDHSEEVGYGVDIESTLRRELAERSEKGNEVPAGWKEISTKSLTGQRDA